jgi:hypothetical protein
MGEVFVQTLTKQDLVKQYKESLKLLHNRIKVLSGAKDDAIKCCWKRKQDPNRDPDVIELNDRLKHLNNIVKDLNEVTKEVQHYYDRWWWRSETLTCNQRKSRSFIYAGPTRH